MVKMMTASNDLDVVIAKRVREERQVRGWTLDRLAAESAVSRAMISKIENLQSSPTAVLLARLAGAMNLSLTALMSERGAPSSALRRVDEQSVWIDPDTGYVRRLVSGGQAEVEIVAVELPVGAVVEFASSAGEVREEQVLVLEGSLTLRAGNVDTRLAPGDLARFDADQVHVFSNGGQAAARYLVIKRQR